MNEPPEGLLLVDKPSGATSHDVVEWIRARLQPARAGHSGTLDPGASGLLPIALGSVTRLVRYLPHAPKVYEGRIRLGVTTSSDDLDGAILSSHPGPPPSAEQVIEAAGRRIGSSLQSPPAVSARKVGGKRMYDLARAGRVVEARPTPIEVARFDLSPTSDPWEWTFEASVSAGTYVRGLARDVGRDLGCGGAVATLRRVSIGPLSVRAAVAVTRDGSGSAVELASAVLPPESIPLALPTVVVANSKGADRFRAGLAAPILPHAHPPAAVRVLDPDGRLLGVGQGGESSVLPRVVLAPPPPRRRSGASSR